MTSYTKNLSKSDWTKIIDVSVDGRGEASVYVVGGRNIALYIGPSAPSSTDYAALSGIGVFVVMGEKNPTRLLARDATENVYALGLVETDITIIVDVSATAFKAGSVNNAKNQGVLYPYGMPDFTGLLSANPQHIVLCDDTFEDDHRGWGPLLTPSSTAGTLLYNNTTGCIAHVKSRGLPRIVALTDNLAGQGAMAIKRMSEAALLPVSGGRYLTEFILVPEQRQYDSTRPLAVTFGLDYADGSGNRGFAQFRWLNYNEANSSQPMKWQANMNSSSLSYVDLNGGLPFSWVTNENKAFPVYMAFVVNTKTHKYEGFRVGAGANRVALGTLATVPDQSLVQLGSIVTGSLPTFAGGLNPYFEIINRTNATQTAAQFGMAGCRVTLLNNGD